MKMKFIAAAVAALSSAAAFAAPLNPQTVTVAADHIVYVGGASAQKNALDNILRNTTDVFSSPADVVKITGPNGSLGYLGTAGGQPMLVIYNSTNGSAAGLNELLSSGTGEAEANVLALSGANNSCTAAAGSASNWTATCTGAAAHEIDMALSDVYATEFGSSGSLCTAVSATCPGPAYLPLTGIKNAASANSTGLEGFGVIVNATLYNDLLAQNISEGVLPGSCSSAVAPGSVSATCQPSVRSRDYAGLVTAGAGWDSSVLTGVPSLTVNVHRRDQFSGTQAASNIFFLDNVCGSKGYFGALTPARATDSYAGVTYYEETSTGAVETGVAGTTAGQYGIGVVSTAEKDNTNGGGAYWFVKIDGVSPTVFNGAYDSTHKATLLNGSYTFATEMGAYIRSVNTGSAVAYATVQTLANSIANNAKAPVGGLNGIGYLDNSANWPDGVQSKYAHGGNNCAPLH